MDALPKLLISTIEQVSRDQTLLTWNINSNGDLTTVTIRYSESGHAARTPMSRCGTGMRGKSPSQRKRDMYRKRSFIDFTPPRIAGVSDTIEEHDHIDGHRQVCGLQSESAIVAGNSDISTASL